MKNVFVLFTILVVVSVGSLHLKPRIIDGDRAEAHQFPYQAVIHFDNNETCGGSLISENYILTAASCTEGASIALIKLGAHDLSVDEKSVVDFFSTEIIPHEDYIRLDLNNIAVIKLPYSVNFTSNIKPVSLPSSPEDDFVGETATFSGWGTITGDNEQLGNKILHYFDVEVVSNEECQTQMRKDSTILCTTVSGYAGTCGWDVGGPLVTSDGIQIGIATFHVGDCGSGFPSGFTKVSSFLGWIEANTDIKIK